MWHTLHPATLRTITRLSFLPPSSTARFLLIHLFCRICPLFSYFADSFLPPSLCAHWKSGNSLSLPLYLFLSLSLTHSFPSSFSFHLVKPLEFCFNFFIGFSGCFTFLRAGVRVSNTALILSSPGLSLCHWLFCSHDFPLPPPVIVCLHATAFINSSQVFEFLSKGHDRRQGEYRLHHSALPT